MSNMIFERHRRSNPALPFSIHISHVQSSQVFMANWHDNIEFLYCFEGSGKVKCDVTEHHMKVGDTIAINPRCLHSITSDTSVKYYCLILDNDFFTENAIDIEKIRFNEKITDAKAGELMFRVANCINDKDDEYYVTATRLAVLEYMYYLTKNHSTKMIKKAGKISKSHAAVLEAIEYINYHFAEKLTLDDISTKVGFSRYHFARIFKENTGLTLIEYINARRCDTACFLLRETKKTIGEICTECGFDTPSYFAKAFCRIHGILPSEYREKHSQNASRFL